MLDFESGCFLFQKNKGTSCSQLLLKTQQRLDHFSYLFNFALCEPEDDLVSFPLPHRRTLSNAELGNAGNAENALDLHLKLSIGEWRMLSVKLCGLFRF